MFVKHLGKDDVRHNWLINKIDMFVKKHAANNPRHNWSINQTDDVCKTSMKDLRHNRLCL